MPRTSKNAASEGAPGLNNRLRRRLQSGIPQEIVSALEDIKHTSLGATARQEIYTRYAEYPNWSVRYAALELLAEFGNAGARQTLLKHVRDRSQFAQWAAVKGIARFAGANVRDALRKVLTSRSVWPVTEVAALEGLCDKYSEELWEVVADKLRNSPSGLVRGYAASTIAAWGQSKRGTALLTERIRDETEAFPRLSVEAALVRLGHRDRLIHLAQFLHDPDYHNRCAAVMALAEFATGPSRRRVVSAIRQLLKEEQTVAVASLCESVLKKISYFPAQN